MFAINHTAALFARHKLYFDWLTEGRDLDCEHAVAPPCSQEWVSGVIGSRHLDLDSAWEQQNQWTHCVPSSYKETSVTGSSLYFHLICQHSVKAQ